MFVTTSPRTPEKMIPEIKLLIKHFNGEKWNAETQKRFMEILKDEQYFNGKGEKDPAFSARDRINRAPKSLGFITLSPKIGLTPAGKALITSARTEEIFLRQLLKFQIPSPYHKPTLKAARFCVKPYLELLRMIRTMGTLKFDELQIFGMQLTDWHKFDTIVHKITEYRKAKLRNNSNYKSFKSEYIKNELKYIYAEKIEKGETRTRESNDTSLNRFLETQSRNMRDYADACFRYLRATGLINVSHIGKSISIVPERIEDVDYILENTPRDPCFIDNETLYKEYLGDTTLPRLLTDDKYGLIKKLRTEFPQITISGKQDTAYLKNLLNNEIEKRKSEILDKQISEIKNYKLYDDIQHTFRQISENKLYDAPLILEWNTWRAMTMLDGGNIKANLNFDDFGKPMSTAQGNMADIICDYDDYLLIVEVTMASGQKQYETEGESVSRHLGKIKNKTKKPCYCLFIAPHINNACIAHFYALHKINISYYGGKSVIVPMNLNVFQKMLEDSYQASGIPTHAQVRKIFEYSERMANTCENETEWFNNIQKYAISWTSF